MARGVEEDDDGGGGGGASASAREVEADARGAREEETAPSTTTTTSTKDAFVVRARWQEGADIGPVVVPGRDATLMDLKRALFDATWCRSEDVVDGVVPSTASSSSSSSSSAMKPPSAEYVRVLVNGKILGPDHMPLRAFGLACDNNERVIHIVVGSRPYDDGAHARSQGASTKSSRPQRTQPTCCSIM